MTHFTANPMKPKAEITLAWLYARTIPEGDCLIWQGEVSNGRDPRARMNGVKLYVRRAVWELVRGMKMDPARKAGISCGTLHCVHPDHIVARTQAQVNTGKRSIVGRARIAEACRARFVSQEVVQLIRSSALNGREAAQFYGVSKSSVNNIRVGIRRRDYTASPFAGLGAR